MNPEQAFLDAIIADPADDTARLVFADWLEDHNQFARAEFIRCSFALEHLGPFDCPTPRVRRYVGGELPRVRCGSCPFCLLARRLEELMHAGHCFSLATLPHATIATPLSPAAALPAGLGVPTFFFRRGFPATCICTQDWWLEHGPQAVREAPLEEVRLSDKEPTRHGEVSAWYWKGLGPTTFHGPTTCTLSAALYDTLEGGVSDFGGAIQDYPEPYHGLPNAATRALSAACLRWAHGQD